MKAYGSLRPSHKSHANVIMRALLGRLGGKFVLRTEVVPDDATLFLQWGFKKTNALVSAILAKIPYVIIDLGYFDDTRYERFSVSINGLHGMGMPVDGVLDLPPRPHPKIEDWKEGGRMVQIIGQMPGDAALRGENIEVWMHHASLQATEAFGKPARKRPHPKMINPWEPSLPALESTFEETYVMVTYTSTVAVQSVLAGVPTVAMHPASSAFAVCSARMKRETPTGREAWVHTLSHGEYSMTDERDLDNAAVYIAKAYPQATREAALGAYDAGGAGQ